MNNGEFTPGVAPLGRLDPVCGMEVAEDTAFRTTREGMLYLFCSGGCREKFLAAPEKFLATSPAERVLGKGCNDESYAAGGGTHDDGVYTCPMHPEVRQQGPGSCPKCGMALEPLVAVAIVRTEYTCPMHPEIVQDHPGSCPKCGMALEPRTVMAEEENNEELIDMVRRFRIGAALATPVFLLAMVADLAPQWLPEGLSMRIVQWIEFVLATPVVLWAGWPFLVCGWQSVRSWNRNMFTLIALGVGGAWLYSVAALLLPELFPPVMQRAGGTVPVYFEVAAVITVLVLVLVLLGQVLELRARSSTNAAIRKLLGLAPNIAQHYPVPKCYASLKACMMNHYLENERVTDLHGSIRSTELFIFVELKRSNCIFR